jgi:hypothetical protein
VVLEIDENRVPGVLRDQAFFMRRQGSRGIRSFLQEVRMERVALLRDMINWCVQQPVRGTRFEPDDERMRSLEEHIFAPSAAGRSSSTRSTETERPFD